MTGDSFAWSTLLSGVAIVLILIAGLAPLLRRARTSIQTAELYCPWARRGVVVRHLTDETGDPIGVVSCTVFGHPAVVTCQRQCLTGENRGDRTDATRLPE